MWKPTARHSATPRKPARTARRLRRTLVAILAAAFAALLSTPAQAAPTVKAPSTLAQLWTAVFQTPTSENPFGTGGPGTACWNLGRTLAPFGPTGVPSCTVTTGTQLFIAGSSNECSVIEGLGTTEAQLRACARSNDVQTAPVITLDGQALPVTETETALVNVTLPADNLFGAAAGTTTQLVAHGWVSPVHPLTPGTHTVVINNGGPLITTSINVTPGRRPA